jgi:hypothetical protein
MEVSKPAAMGNTLLTDLPNELLFLVFEFVASISRPSKQALCCLALTSARFRAIAERLIYQDFSAQNEETSNQAAERPATGKDRFSRFLRSIIERPELGLYVQYFNEVPEHFFSNKVTKNQKFCYSQTMKAALNPQAYAAIDSVGFNSLEVGLAILLLLTPNLESFARQMRLLPPKWEIFLFSDIFNRGMLSQSSASVSFSKLRRISLGFNQWSTSAQLSALRSVLPLPALKELSLNGASWSHSGMWLAKSGCSSGVTDLTLRNSQVNGIMLQGLLPCFRELKSFTYMDNFVIMGCHALADMISELARAQRSTLESFVYDSRAGSSSRTTKIPSLERFVKLREITLPSAGILSGAPCDYGSVRETLIRRFSYSTGQLPEGVWYLRLLLELAAMDFVAFRSYVADDAPDYDCCSAEISNVHCTLRDVRGYAR